MLICIKIYFFKQNKIISNLNALASVLEQTCPFNLFLIFTYLLLSKRHPRQKIMPYLCAYLFLFE